MSPVTIQAAGLSAAQINRVDLRPRPQIARIWRRVMARLLPRIS
jgi:hypothetical protein